MSTTIKFSQQDQKPQGTEQSWAISEKWQSNYLSIMVWIMCQEKDHPMEECSSMQLTAEFSLINSLILRIRLSKKSLIPYFMSRSSTNFRVRNRKPQRIKAILMRLSSRKNSKIGLWRNCQLLRRTLCWPSISHLSNWPWKPTERLTCISMHISLRNILDLFQSYKINLVQVEHFQRIKRRKIRKPKKVQGLTVKELVTMLKKMDKVEQVLKRLRKPVFHHQVRNLISSQISSHSWRESLDWAQLSPRLSWISRNSHSMRKCILSMPPSSDKDKPLKRWSTSKKSKELSLLLKSLMTRMAYSGLRSFWSNFKVTATSVSEIKLLFYSTCSTMESIGNYKRHLDPLLEVLVNISSLMLLFKETKSLQKILKSFWDLEPHLRSMATTTTC